MKFLSFSVYILFNEVALQVTYSFEIFYIFTMLYIRNNYYRKTHDLLEIMNDFSTVFCTVLEYFKVQNMPVPFLKMKGSTYGIFALRYKL